MNKPEWMSDPTISHIPQEKLDFLCVLFDKVKDKNQKEIMPFLMAMSGKMKNTVRFSTEEMQLVMAAIKRASSSEEQKQIEKVIKMASEKSRKP